MSGSLVRNPKPNGGERRLPEPVLRRPGGTDSGLAVAGRRFVSAFQVLLRSLRIYPADHPRTVENLAAADRELRAILQQIHPRSFRIEYQSGTWTCDTHTLSDPGGELQWLGTHLQRCGIAAFIFLPEINLGELNALAGLLREHQSLSPRANAQEDWTARLTELRIRGIQVRTPGQEKSTDSRLAVFVAAVVARAKESVARAGKPLARVPMERNELRATLALLAAVAANFQQDSSEAARGAALAGLHAALAEAPGHLLGIVASAATKEPHYAGETLEDYLGRLAESLLLDFGAQQLEQGLLRPSQAREFCSEFASELTSYAGEPATAGGAFQLVRARWGVEAYREHLHEALWARLSRNKVLEILRGREAWCVPPATLLEHLQPRGGDSQSLDPAASAARRRARFLVLSYAQGLEAQHSSARRAVAGGLLELRPLLERLWRKEMPGELRRTLVRALARETVPEVAGLLVAAVDMLAAQAVRMGDYPELEFLLDSIEKSNRAGSRADLARLPQELLQKEDRWLVLVEAGLSGNGFDVALARILARQPERLLDRFGILLTSSENDRLLPAMARLLEVVGEPALGALQSRLDDPRPQRVATAVQLLLVTDAERLLAALPHALPSWEWKVQDLAVSELSKLGLPGYARVVLEVVPHAHPLVLPLLLDQLGLAREAAALPVLTQIAAGQHERTRDVFVRIKAVEALGRILAEATRAAPPAQVAAATDLLRTILRQRSGLTYAEPAGLRAAAEEALALVENRPSSARVRAVQQITARLSQPHARPRRYLRVPLDSPLDARVLYTQAARAASLGSALEPLPARVKTISLGGAYLEAPRPFQVGDTLQVEIRTGLRHIHGMAVVRNIAPTGGGVEFVHMGQDDRERLRRLLTRLLRD